MKKPAILRGPAVLLVCCFLAYGCSKKSTGPSGDGDGTTAEKTVTIGPEGGELAFGDFSLTVPTGAFAENCTLRLAADPDDDTFGEARATRVFRVEGFPEDFTRPIRLAIQCSRPLSGETFIAEADSAFDPLTGGFAGIYRYRPASDSSGHLVCTLTPSGGETPAFRRPFRKNSSSLRKRTLKALGIDGHVSVTTRLFKVTRNLKDPIIGPLGQAMNDMLEDNWEIILDETGLDFSEKWLQLPIDVMVGPFGPELADQYSPVVACSHNPLFWRMGIDQAAVKSNQMQIIRILSGMYMLQYSMLGPGIIDENIGESADPADSWVHLAFMHWSEELFSDDPDFRAPLNFPGNEMAPFHGMVGSALYLNERHDRGMAAAIKFLSRQDYFTRAEIFQTYQDINGIGRSAPQDPTEALLSNVQELITVWWPDFFKSYISGGVYGVSPSVFLKSGNLSGTWTIDPDGDTEKVFSSSAPIIGAYPDLSAKLFLVDASDPDIGENDRLLIDVNGEVTDQGLSALVFAVQPDRLEYLGGGPATSGNPEIANLKTNAEAGVTQYLICVVNSTSHDGYMGSTAVDLNLTVTQEDTSGGSSQPGDPPVVPPGFNTCNIAITMEAEYFKTYADGTSETVESNVYGRTQRNIPGAFEEYEFNSNETVLDAYGNTVTNTIRAVVSADLDTMTTLSWVQTDTKEGDHFRRHELTAENIPLRNTPTPDRYYYEVNGTDVCGFVTDYRSESQNIRWNGIDASVSQRTWCEDDALLRVILEKE
ncbi:hypothetical protein JW777_00820 [bacterium]|nr:hypothetical protein [bacterium]